MQNSKDLIEKIESAATASSTTSTTEAGRLDNSADQALLVDAINQVFALFRTNYHNQYYSAFGDDNNSVAVSKRLWLQKLSGFSPQVICSAAEKIIAESDFLPTLYRMLQACKRVRMPGNLPTGYDAYREACIAPSPKVENNWSHPVVYLAGRDCGWYLLANSGESGAFKRFSEIYRSYCDRVAAGERFAIDTPAALPETSSAPADREIAEVQLGKLRKLFP